MNEAELDSQQCAEVALYMYRQWQEAMKPPLFIYKDFPTWLNDILDTSNNTREEKS